ncbi:hypothetical protein FYJ43_10510 [Cutibacterium sp. WCA-380-WT-3A]|uniref:Uncharacterized protein n=1 Tax=Cutibacterium porci TaxID=2605781 RepID=A0A7K0J9L6_9ACTN|nr:hypothetical protein [Cutibacterium porci]
MVFPRRCHRSPGVRIQKMPLPEMRTVPLWQEPDTDNIALFFHIRSHDAKSIPGPIMLHNMTGLRHHMVSEPEWSTT